MEKLLAADGIILASPVYFHHVTAQLKSFIDRSLGYGHKPRTTWKPGLAVSVSAGMGETETGHYLAKLLHTYGAFAVGTLTAIATGPGGFLGKAAVEARARDLAMDLARAIKEKRQYPPTDENLSYYLFMRDLITREKDLMQGDYRYWRETGLSNGFEAYVQQEFSRVDYDPETRTEWLREMVKEEKTKVKVEGNRPEEIIPDAASSPASVKSCLELLQSMPSGFRSEAAHGLSAIYQFEISGSEQFNAYLQIRDSRCTFHEGRHEKPDLVIKSPAKVWLAIARKEMNGQIAFMSGKYRAKGNIALLLKLNKLFEG
jgi:putative sterol carrier protein